MPPGSRRGNQKNNEIVIWGQHGRHHRRRPSMVVCPAPSYTYPRCASGICTTRHPHNATVCRPTRIDTWHVFQQNSPMAISLRLGCPFQYTRFPWYVNHDGVCVWNYYHYSNTLYRLQSLCLESILFLKIELDRKSRWCIYPDIEYKWYHKNVPRDDIRVVHIWDGSICAIRQ